MVQYYNISLRIVMIQKKDIQEYKNISEYAYHSIRFDILTLTLVPDTKISEQSMADLLNISKTPVREAIIKLAGENLLTVLPQRGTFVSKINLSHVNESYFVRVILEQKIMQLATRYCTSLYVQQCQQILNDHQQIVNTAYLDHFYYDALFHKTIFEACGKLNVWNTLESIDTDYKRLRMLAFSNYQEMNNVIEDHQQILNAIIQKDVKLVHILITKHLQKLSTEIELIVKENPNLFEGDYTNTLTNLELDMFIE